MIWQDFNGLKRAVATGNFRLETVTFLGSLLPAQKATNREIDMEADLGMYIPSTDEVHHFCLRYHLKGVCNINCGGRHSDRILSQGEFVQLTEWGDRFCGVDAQPPVEEICTPEGTVASHASPLSGRSRHTGGTRGRCRP